MRRPLWFHQNWWWMVQMTPSFWESDPLPYSTDLWDQGDQKCIPCILPSPIQLGFHEEFQVWWSRRPTRSRHWSILSRASLSKKESQKEDLPLRPQICWSRLMPPSWPQWSSIWGRTAMRPCPVKRGITPRGRLLLPDTFQKWFFQMVGKKKESLQLHHIGEPTMAIYQTKKTVSTMWPICYLADLGMEERESLLAMMHSFFNALS